LNHSISEVILIGITAKVLEGQHGDGWLVGDGKRRLKVQFDWIARQTIGWVLVPDVTNEPIPLARNCADQSLLLPAISDSLADGVDMAGQRRVGHRPSAPN